MELLIALGLFVGLILAWLRLPATASELKPELTLAASEAPAIGERVTA